MRALPDPRALMLAGTAWRHRPPRETPTSARFSSNHPSDFPWAVILDLPQELGNNLPQQLVGRGLGQDRFVSPTNSEARSTITEASATSTTPSPLRTRTQTRSYSRIRLTPTTPGLFDRTVGGTADRTAPPITGSIVFIRLRKELHQSLNLVRRSVYATEPRLVHNISPRQMQESGGP